LIGADGRLQRLAELLLWARGQFESFRINSATVITSNPEIMSFNPV
jgi:hypothetical protein